MSTRLFWNIKTPAQNELPISLKWALEEINRTFVTEEFLRGFLACLDKNSLSRKERDQILALLSAMESGLETKLEWR